MRVLIVLLFLFVGLPIASWAQAEDSLKVRQRPLLQLGGFPYYSDGFALHLELERTFRRKQYLTYGSRIEYGRIPSQDENNVYMGLQLKFYPTYWSHSAPYHGLFVGIEPLIVFSTQSGELVRSGPGLSSIVGYQHLFNNMFYLGIEANVMYSYNLFDESMPNSDAYSKGIFQNSFACLKIGFKI